MRTTKIVANGRSLQPRAGKELSKEGGTGGTEASVGVPSGQLLFRAAPPAGQSHTGLDAGNGSSGIEARSRDPKAQDGHRLHGLHRYFRPRVPADVETNCRQLAGAVLSGNCEEPAPLGSLHDHAPAAQNQGRGGPERRDQAPEMHDRRLDGRGPDCLEPSVGVPLLGSECQEADRGGDTSAGACGSPSPGGPIASSCAPGRGAEELQDGPTHVSEGQLRGRGSSLDGVNRAPGRVQQHLLQCTQDFERLSDHEIDWRTRAGAAADQAAQGVLHGDHVLRLGEEQCALEQRRLGRRAVAAHEVVRLSVGAPLLTLNFL